MYILIEECNNWADYIKTTSYELIKGSDDKDELQKYMKDNYNDMDDDEWEMFYYIQEVPMLEK